MFGMLVLDNLDKKRRTPVLSYNVKIIQWWFASPSGQTPAAEELFSFYTCEGFRRPWIQLADAKVAYMI